MTAVSTELTRYKMFIDGQKVGSVSGRFFESLNPFTGKPWAAMPDGAEEDVDRAAFAMAEIGKARDRCG